MATALGAWWVHSSERRTARFIRTLMADARREMLPAPVKPNPRAWSDHQVTLGWLGHATVLINFYGVRILTDPVFSARVGLGLGLGTVGPKRYIAPALPSQDLPPVDVLLLSHAHYDHLDLPSLRRFPPNTFTVTARVTRDLLAKTPLRQVTELGWGERAKFQGTQGELEIEALEVNHWGRRWPDDTARGYNGYVLRREGQALLFGGDTAMTALFAGYRSKGPFVAALMPIAAYRPWIHSHCTPEEAVAMARAAGARYFLPVHHHTFKLSDEPMAEPLERLEMALAKEPESLGWRKVGETFVCPGG